LLGVQYVQRHERQCVSYGQMHCHFSFLARRDLLFVLPLCPMRRNSHPQPEGAAFSLTVPLTRGPRPLPRVVHSCLNQHVQSARVGRAAFGYCTRRKATQQRVRQLVECTVCAWAWVWRISVLGTCQEMPEHTCVSKACGPCCILHSISALPSLAN